MQQQTRAYLFGLSTVLCWSTVATAFKLSLHYLRPAELLLFATLTACGVLLVILYAQGKLHQLTQLTRRDYLSSLLFGALNPLIYYLVLLEAYALLPAQEAQAINYTWALTMSLLAVPLLGHVLRWQDIIAAMLCYCGVLMIATQGHPFELNFTNTKGLALALLSTIIWAFYWLLNTRDQREPMIGLFLNFVIALPLILLYCLMTGQLSLPTWQGIAGAVYIGIFEMGLTFALWLTAMKLTNSTASIANLIFIAPFLSLLFISLILGETIRTSTLYGLFMIIGGLLLQQLARTPAS